MTCSEFRQAFRPGKRDAETLAHLRSCADCLEYAVTLDPECLFVSLGGGEVLPPDGVDEFVNGVMDEIRIREAEQRAATAQNSPRRYWWSLAAAIVIAVFATVFAFRPAVTPDAVDPSETLAVSRSVELPAETTIVPVIENYDAANATIIEMPMQSDDDLRIVMIFDESLPVDL